MFGTSLPSYGPMNRVHISNASATGASMTLGPTGLKELASHAMRVEDSVRLPHYRNCRALRCADIPECPPRR